MTPLAVVGLKVVTEGVLRGQEKPIKMDALCETCGRALEPELDDDEDTAHFTSPMHEALLGLSQVEGSTDIFDFLCHSNIFFAFNFIL